MEEGKIYLTYDVALFHAGENKLAIVEIIMNLTGYDLHQTEQLLDDLPRCVLQDVDWDTADVATQQLFRAGAEVEMQRLVNFPD